MAVIRTIYNSPIEAFDALMRSLSAYEAKYHIPSADFFSRYNEGKLDDSKDFIEGAGDYQHYLDLKRELEQKLTAIA
ncbi:MAG: hypothetical protein HZA13_08840 [Nitrospirae bacterium]|nr:hypothetical protein [Nitrospirota bacterium]